MKSKNLIFSLATLVVLLFTSCGSEKKNTNIYSNVTPTATIEVIQFHSERRCVACKKVEELTREALYSNTSVSFSLVNVDDKQNEAKVKQFEATGTALFLYNTKTGVKKDITNFAFMNSGNKNKFIEGLKKEIQAIN